MLLAHRVDAERVLAVLGKRLVSSGCNCILRRPGWWTSDRSATRRTGRQRLLPTTFVFLGFLHLWGRSRYGKHVVRQFTAKERYARSLTAFPSVPADDALATAGTARTAVSDAQGALRLLRHLG